MKTKKRFLSILLSFALMLTMMPVLGLSLTAYAAGETWSESFTTDGGTIDGGVYVTADITLTIPDGITLNVNGGISGGRTLTVVGKGTLIINGMNGSDNDGHDPSALTGGSGGVSFTGNIIVDGPTVTVKGGTGGKGGITTNGGSGGSGGNGVEGDVTVNSGSIEATGGNGGTGGDGHEAGGGGGIGGVGITGVLTVTGGSATVTGGTGGKGGGGESGGLGSKGADGITGAVTVTGGSATVTGGTGGKDGDESSMGDVGKAVSGTITGSAEESDDNSNWTAVSGTTSTKQYVKVTPSVTAYPLWVGKTQVNSANAGDILGNQTASYVAGSNTLTLKGATITIGHVVGDSESGIYYNGSEPLNIDLADGSENTVEIAGHGHEIEMGICVDASSETLPRLNISGKGQLTVSGSNYGIHAPIITINGCDVTASGGSGIHSYRGSIEIKGGSVYASATNYAIHAASDMVSYDVIINAGSKVTASGGNKAIFSKVKNAIAGIGWTDTAGTTGEANIAVGEHTRTELANFKKVQFPAAHTHDFTYTASGDTITATCSAEGCPLPVVGDQHVATLTIAAPLHTTYGDGNDAAAQITDANNIQGAAKVQYQKKTDGSYGTSTETAPTDAGTYKASITVGGETASVEYTIAQAATSITENPTVGEITYGQTLADSTLTGGTASKEGRFEWKDSTVAPAVSDSQTTEYDVVFTPTDGNYGPAECKVKLTVNKADSSVAQPPTAKTLTYNGQAQELVTAGTATGGEMWYALGNATEATQLYTTTIPTETNAGTYYVWYKVVGDENHNDVEPKCVKVTIAEEKKQDEPVKPEEPETPAKTVDMYRLYNPNSGEHFYTANAAEKDNLVSLGWTFEGVGWKAPATSNTPVYRVYNPNAGDHHYTTNKAERDNLISVGWKDEGIGWYSDDAQSLPIFRQYNPNAVSGAHNFTSNKGENDWLVSLGWKGEGIGWYGVK